MATSSVSMTDDVLWEIGEQVSLAMRRKLPSWSGTAFDIARGVEMYRGHLGISIPSSEMSLQDAPYTSPDEGGAPQDVGVYVLKRNGSPVYVGQAVGKGGLRTRLQQHARGADTSSKDIRDNREELTVEYYSTGTVEAAQSLEAKKIDELGTSEENGGWNKRPERPDFMGPDIIRRAGVNIATSVVSDLALFAIGGAAMEIREGWRNPGEMSILERCERLIRAIWRRLMITLQDRTVREIGSEAIVGAMSILTAAFRMAAAAAEKIVEALRRFWMDFVAGKLKTPADVVAAALKAAFAVASVGVALAVEAQLTPLFGSIPFGDILTALCAAVVAGVMIVLGNRAIEAVVSSLCGIFEGAAAAKRRRKEIEALCAEALPQLVADRERLQSVVDSHLTGRAALFSRTFTDLQSTRDVNDIDGFLAGLCRLNKAYGALLPWSNFDDVDSAMLSPEPLKF